MIENINLNMSKERVKRGQLCRNHMQIKFVCSPLDKYKSHANIISMQLSRKHTNYMLVYIKGAVDVTTCIFFNFHHRDLAFCANIHFIIHC